MRILQKVSVAAVLAILFFGTSAPAVFAQTAGTGALAGTISDMSGAVVADVQVTVTNEATRETRIVTSGPNGNYRVALLPPGSYSVEAKRTGFEVTKQSNVKVNVTEITTLPVLLKIGSVQQSVTVTAAPQLIQTESHALGRVTDTIELNSLPLDNRNFTEILALSPGVAANVTNAGELGHGSQVLMWVEGGRSYDNDYQLNGVDINDAESGGAGLQTGTEPVPSPDAIAEFKVVTSQADASYGYNGGGHINVVTKSGSNEFHGTAFDFFRNTALDANSFFNNLVGQPRGLLKQNQFGGTLGGPVKRDKLMFFVSYQGTRQTNGLGATSTASVVGPPLTDDRSAAALGALFGGQTGSFGGVAIAPDGSNINPAALNLLNLKLPDGSYYLKTPQIITNGEGLSTFSIPATFREDQGVANLDYNQSSKSTISGRFFYSNGDQVDPFAPRSGSNLPGSPLLSHPTYWDLALIHTYAFRSNLLNETRFGFHRVDNNKTAESAYSFSGIGITVPDPQQFDAHPSIYAGPYVTGSTFPIQFVQNNFDFRDTLSYLKGKQSLRFGGEILRAQSYQSKYAYPPYVAFNTFPDFLLGQSAAQNGSPYSNVIESYILAGNVNRHWQAWEPNAFVQDDIKVTSRLTLNLGFRYEHQGPFDDQEHVSTNFYPQLADLNPPASGTLQGYVVSRDFPGSIPNGVTRLSTGTPINETGVNTWGPRLGFAYQIPGLQHVVLRGGYGRYYSRLLSNVLLQLETSPPYALGVDHYGTANADATLQDPFPGVTFQFPSWPAYSPSTSLSPSIVDANVQPGINNAYTLGIQTELPRDFLWEVTYSGRRSNHLKVDQEYNVANLASASDPIRGQTTNTLDNLSLRVPLLGFSVGGVYDPTTIGVLNYDSLQLSLTKRLSKGLQFLASYTFSNSLDNTYGQGGSHETAFGGSLLGIPADPHYSYGPSDFNRRNRLIISYVYALPQFTHANGWGKLVNGWSTSGVVTLQSGQYLTVFDYNSGTIYGLYDDPAQFAPGCSRSQAITKGSVKSKLNDYFNSSCFGTPPNLSDDPTTPAYGLGNTGRGVGYGPGQNNFDLSILKVIPIRESKTIQFRTDFFNAFNHAQFANPGDTTIEDGAFGVISATSVAPRIVQFTLKFIF